VKVGIEEIKSILSDLRRRGEAAKNAGALSLREVHEGAPIPEGWKYDAVIDYFLPPNVILFGKSWL
jgi:hypothetical protein